MSSAQAQAHRRLQVVGGHFETVKQASAKQQSDVVAALQHLLEHDNHEMRALMKERMKHDIYIPWVHHCFGFSQPGCPALGFPLGFFHIYIIAHIAGAMTWTCAMSASWPC